MDWHIPYEEDAPLDLTKKNIKAEPNETREYDSYDPNESSHSSYSGEYCWNHHLETPFTDFSLSQYNRRHSGYRETNELDFRTHTYESYPRQSYSPKPLHPNLENYSHNTIGPEISQPVMISAVSSTFLPSLSPAPSLSPPSTKGTRPFKAMARVLTSQEAVRGPYEDGRFAQFRELMLQQIKERNGGSLSVSNPRMRRSVRACGADADYLERRRRNNAAAKRSRDLRRRNEDELAIRAAFLEAENQRLEAELGKIITNP